MRKIFENITYEVANENGVNILNANGGIPQEFSEEGYKLFGDLSNVIHREFEESEALTKYPAFLRLVLGVLDKQIDRKEMREAKAVLGWNSGAEK